MATQTRKITVDTAALFTGRAVGLVLGVIRLNYLMTILGQDGWGTLSFATFGISLFQSLFDLGIAQIVTRDLSRNPSSSRQILGVALTVKLAVAVIAGGSILAGVAVLRYDPVETQALVWTTIAMAFNSISTVLQGAFQAHRRMILVSIASMVNDALLSIAIIVVLPLLPQLMTALLLIAVLAGANLLILFLLYVRSFGLPEFSLNTEAFRMLLKEGTPIAVASFGITTYMYLGPVMLKHFRGKEEVGIFAAGYRIISILTLVPAAFNQVVFPVFSDFSANARHKLKKSLHDALRVMAELSFPMAAGGAILAHRIIALICPVGFEGASTVLAIIFLGISLGYLAWVVQSYLLALNRQKFCMWISLTTALLVTMTNFLVIPWAGYVGVAVITMCTDVFLCCSQLIVVTRRDWKGGDFLVFLRILLATLVMASVVYLVQGMPLPVSIGAGIVVYGGMLFALRIPGDQEMEIVMKLRDRFVSV